ncbi:MAG: S8 family peptidase [Rhodospirillaceae bacterium]|nr:S8 family peptidase [Rhodospirillaceae bacterium]
MVGVADTAYFRASALPAFAAALAIGGCDGPRTPRPPTEIFLFAPTATDLQETANQTLTVTVRAHPRPLGSLTVSLEFSGSATRDHDYAVSADVIAIPAHTASVDFQIDVYRDFDAEDDETIIVSVGTIEGNATPGSPARVEINVVDGGAAAVDKSPADEGRAIAVFPSHYVITERSIEFGAIVFPPLLGGPGPHRLIVEYSTDLAFDANVQSLAIVDLPVVDPGMQFFPEIHDFSLPLSGLLPNESYHIGMYVNELPRLTRTGVPAGKVVLTESGVVFSFATDADGSVTTRCAAPVRTPDAAAGDPLFDRQWHLQNTGQTAFAANPGIPGADLRMSGAIRDGLDGDGVILAVVDTGLEICHPDLAANVEAGKSFNFAFETSAGSSPADPFNHNILGDHGTSVAGVAAAVANNGLGGRGVAPGVELRGYNVGAVLFADVEMQMFSSLGASSRDPDSSGVDIFNMSFGSEVPSGNSAEDFVSLMKLGTGELRSGRGALYVKAAGNDFSFCRPQHPLNADVGCASANSDPDNNLPYLIVVGAFNANDVKSSYSSAGANLWVVAPAGEIDMQHPGIVTTDQAGIDAGFSLLDAGLPAGGPPDAHGDYIASFGGTSAATPATAGAIAILLGANPDLTWRDVKHILAASARKIDPEIEAVRAAFNGTPQILQHAWQTNAAGYSFHNWYGFGAVAVDAAVAMAETHTPDSLGKFVESGWFEASDIGAAPLAIPDNDGVGVTHSLDVAGLPDSANIEAVVLEIRVDHDYASDLGVELVSPAGTVSVLNTPFNAVLRGHAGLSDWQLMSNAFYGESPNGAWTLSVADLAENDVGQLSAWRLRFYYGDHP